MNEDLLKHLFEKYQLSSVGTFDEFKNDMSSLDVRKSFFNNHELSKVGTFEEFENDLGANNLSSLTPHQKALLDTISDVESPDYNVITIISITTLSLLSISNTSCTITTIGYCRIFII